MPYELVAVFEQGEWVLLRGREVGSRRPVFAVTTLDGENARLRRSWELRDALDPDGTLRPLAYELLDGRYHLILPDPGGRVLVQLGAPLGVGEALRAGVAIAEALKQFHTRGFVHRDLKPSAILYDAEGGRAWLAGTGLSLRIGGAGRRNEALEQMAGTLAYMAPEQTGRVNWPVDVRSDLYSLGVVLYQLLTGNVPFDEIDPLSVIHAHIARTPEPPCDRRGGIPETVSAVVLRLLAKEPRNRYQTAAGLAWDLRRCVESWTERGTVTPFALGERDVSAQVGIPDRILGREEELAVLDRALASVAELGTPALVFVGGASGVGKSALVDEALRRAVAKGRRVSFGAAKLDGLGRGAPLAALGRALAALLPELHDDDALASAVRAAIHPHGRVLLGILPELRAFFAAEPEPPELAPREAHLRFQQAVRAFVRAFARIERPLALFFDDLQWVDPATLALLRALLTDPEMGPLLVMGAYRTNEVDAALLAQLEETAPSTYPLTLSPLGVPEVTELVGSMIATSPDGVAPLAELIFAKTAGNPFFTIQFMLSLAEERLVTFDAKSLRWRWDLAAVQAHGFADNVVDMMLAKLDRLPARAREGLVHLAFLGDATSPAVLAATLECEPSGIHAEMLPAVRAGLVALTTSAYVFLHDRIRESAYALVEDGGARAALHRRIGERLFAASLPGTLFEVFRQLDRGVSEASRETGVRDAAIALAAAKEAKRAAAYAQAQACLAAGAARLPPDPWNAHYRLAFDIDILRAECELFLGELAVATRRLSALVERTRDLTERAVVTRHLMNAHVTGGRADRAVEVGLSYLRAVGIDWPLHPGAEDVDAELTRMRGRVGDRSTEQLVELPRAEDPVARATLDQVLVDFGAPALFFDRNLFQLSVFGTVDYALEHGVSPAMAWMFAVAGMALTTILEDPEMGRRFARVASGLADRFPGNFGARAHVTLAHHVLPWLDDCRRGDAMAQRAQAAMQAGGELSYLGYGNMHMVTHRFANGAPLREVEDEAAAGRALALSANLSYVVADIDHQVTLVRMLRGANATFGTLDGGDFREHEFEASIATRPVLPTLRVRYFIRKLVARYFGGAHEAAVAAADVIRPFLWSSGGPFPPHFRENADYHLFAALARAALPDAGAQRDRIEEHRQRYARWAATAPKTYASRAALIDAECVRVDGGDAGSLFEHAIALTREQRFVHHEALVLEVASRYWAGRGYPAFAETYRREARDAYRRWGADGKVRELEARFPEIRGPKTHAQGGDTVEQAIDQLDLTTALTVSDAVSSELVHERLVEGLLSLAVKTAGAERALLFLPREGNLVAEALAVTRDDRVELRLEPDESISPSYCESLVRYVASTGKPLVLDDAVSVGPFVSDPYVGSHRCRSLACIPLTRRGQLGGVLYLENNLAGRVFTARRLVTLKFIALQAASALENARLYADLTKARATEQALHETREALGHLARIATLGELTASIAHEVNQPLTAIRVDAATCVRWLNAGKTAEAVAAAVRVGHDAEHAMEVIHRLRSLFRKQGTERTELDVNDAVAEVIALTRSEMTKQGIVTDVRLAPETPRVLANRVQLQQVVMNLVLNAIQALQPVHDRPRRILVSTALAGEGRVRTSVRDSGVGVPKEHVGDLFRPFFSTKKEGTGIGLSISQSIVASHHGKLWHRPNDGPGATFGFDLPSA